MKSVVDGEFKALRLLEKIVSDHNLFNIDRNVQTRGIRKTWHGDIHQSIPGGRPRLG